MGNIRYIQNGHRFFNNRARKSSPGYNGRCNSGKILSLRRGSTLNIPVNATVFHDASKSTSFGKVGNVDVGVDGSIVTVTFTGENGDDDLGYVYQRLSSLQPNFLTRDPEAGELYKFRIRVKASAPDIGFIELFGFNGGSIFGYPSADIENTEWGYIYIEGESRGNIRDYIAVHFTDEATNGSTIEIDISQCDAKRITEVKGQVSYFSAWNKKYNIAELDLMETCELGWNAYGPVIRLWDTEFTDSDFNLLLNSPELLIKWAKGSDIGLSVGTIKENDAVYYPCEDGLALITDENQNSPKYIEVNGDYGFGDDYPISIQESKVVLDDEGVPTGTIDEPKMCDLGNVSLEWEPKLPTYTIIETVEGEIPDRTITGEEIDDIYKTESRWLSYDASRGFEYFVNGIQQAYGAELQKSGPSSGPSFGLPVPTSTKGYTLGATATIGPKDHIKYRSEFKVYTTCMVPKTATCTDSVGGADGTEYNFDKVWTTRCSMFNIKDEE